VAGSLFFRKEQYSARVLILYISRKMFRKFWVEFDKYILFVPRSDQTYLNDVSLQQK